MLNCSVARYNVMDFSQGRDVWCTSKTDNALVIHDHSLTFALSLQCRANDRGFVLSKNGSER